MYPTIFRENIGDGWADLETVIGEADGLAPNNELDSTEELRTIRDPFRDPGRDVVGDGGGKTRTAPGISSGRIPETSVDMNSCWRNSSSTFCSKILTFSRTEMKLLDLDEDIIQDTIASGNAIAIVEGSVECFP